MFSFNSNETVSFEFYIKNAYFFNANSPLHISYHVRSKLILVHDAVGTCSTATWDHQILQSMNNTGGGGTLDIS